jgi:hypothetical protein
MANAFSIWHAFSHSDNRLAAIVLSAAKSTDWKSKIKVPTIKLIILLLQLFGERDQFAFVLYLYGSIYTHTEANRSEKRKKLAAGYPAGYLAGLYQLGDPCDYCIGLCRILRVCKVKDFISPIIKVSGNDFPRALFLGLRACLFFKSSCFFPQLFQLARLDDFDVWVF